VGRGRDTGADRGGRGDATEGTDRAEVATGTGGGVTKMAGVMVDGGGMEQAGGMGRTEDNTGGMTLDIGRGTADGGKVIGAGNAGSATGRMGAGGRATVGTAVGVIATGGTATGGDAISVTSVR